MKPKLRRLEKVALVFSAVAVGAATAFWVYQVGNVLETLRLAYGG